MKAEIKHKAPAKAKKTAEAKKAVEAKKPLVIPLKKIAVKPAVTLPETFIQEMKIPRDRVGVLVGRKGEVKRAIQSRANVHLDISSEGDVIIKGDDTVRLYDVKIIIQAIGRGFSPEVAFHLFNEENTLEIIDVTDYAGKSKKKIERLRGRVIGEAGRSRRTIEELTETAVSVYGKTVAIIGEMEMVALARNAVDMLLSGAPHGATYKMLENKRREVHRRRIESIEDA